MWPLVAIISLLAVALIALIIVLAIQPSGGGDPTPTGSGSGSGSPSATNTESTPTNTLIRIDEGDYVNRPFSEVAADLADLEFGVNQVAGPAAPEPGLVGFVSGLNPTGNLAPGTTIDVRVYGAFPPPAAPQTPAAGGGPFESGDTVTITWPTYGNCPAGHPLQGYNFSITNATSPTDNPVPAVATSLDLLLGDPGQATVSYTAICGGDGIVSNPSGPLTITIE